MLFSDSVGKWLGSGSLFRTLLDPDWDFLAGSNELRSETLPGGGLCSVASLGIIRLILLLRFLISPAVFIGGTSWPRFSINFGDTLT